MTSNMKRTIFCLLLGSLWLAAACAGGGYYPETSGPPPPHQYNYPVYGQPSYYYPPGSFAGPDEDPEFWTLLGHGGG